MLHWRPWVHVVAITPGEQVVMVRQFRPGAEAALLELVPVPELVAGLPRGLVAHASHIVVTPTAQK